MFAATEDASCEESVLNSSISQKRTQLRLRPRRAAGSVVRSASKSKTKPAPLHRLFGILGEDSLTTGASKMRDGENLTGDVQQDAKRAVDNWNNLVRRLPPEEDSAPDGVRAMGYQPDRGLSNLRLVRGKIEAAVADLAAGTFWKRAAEGRYNVPRSLLRTFTRANTQLSSGLSRLAANSSFHEILPQPQSQSSLPPQISRIVCAAGLQKSSMLAMALITSELRVYQLTTAKDRLELAFRALARLPHIPKALAAYESFRGRRVFVVSGGAAGDIALFSAELPKLDTIMERGRLSLLIRKKIAESEILAIRYLRVLKHSRHNESCGLLCFSIKGGIHCLNEESLAEVWETTVKSSSIVSVTFAKHDSLYLSSI